jgi:hypothetical protein
MEKRYKALRTIGMLYKIMGIVAAVVTLLALLASCAMIFFGSSALSDLSRQFNRQFGYMPYRMMGTVFGGLLAAVMVLVYGGGLSLTLYALGEGVYLFIAIEENTRTTAALLVQQSAQQPPAQVVPPVQQ